VLGRPDPTTSPARWPVALPVQDVLVLAAWAVGGLALARRTRPAGGFVRAAEGCQAVPMVGGDVDAETVTEIEDPVQAFVDELEQIVVAHSEVALDGQRSSVRTVETNLGNLIADAYVQQVDQFTEVGQPLVGFQNGGGIRHDSVLPPGEITRADTFDVLPFGNLLSITRDVSSEQLLAVVEHAVSNVENNDGRFGQFSGLSFDDDASAPAGSRVGDITLDDGTPIAVDAWPSRRHPTYHWRCSTSPRAVATATRWARRPGCHSKALGVADQEAFEAYLSGPTEDGALGGVVTAEQLRKAARVDHRDPVAAPAHADGVPAAAGAPSACWTRSRRSWCSPPTGDAQVVQPWPERLWPPGGESESDASAQRL
jgi:hypothetical protein